MRTETERNARQGNVETQQNDASASPATRSMKPSAGLPGSLIPENARHAIRETHSVIASATPATPQLKPRRAVPGSPIKRNARQAGAETHLLGASAAPASEVVKPSSAVPGSPIKENARPRSHETHENFASATPARFSVKPNDFVPGSPIHKKGRQAQNEAHASIATSTAPASRAVKPKDVLPGSSPSSRKGRQEPFETHRAAATSTPAKERLKPISPVPGSPLSTIVEALKARHRERRHWMGVQQVLDRKLESYIRINETDWHPTDDEAARKKANEEVAAKIKTARAGEGDPWLIEIVETNDKARAPADPKRALQEKDMEKLAKQLPVASWVETIPGFGLLGLATIIAETGDLSNYSTVSKVWKRLGYAPYRGKAGSTWKREKWRDAPALTKEEWIANPFSGRRYALIHTISIWLLNKQWIGAAKTEDGVGKPNGKYGEVYAKRRAHTAITHPDWTKQHSHMDGLRKMMKEVLKDLHSEWNARSNKNGGSPIAP